MKIKEITINRFDGGKAFDKRSVLSNQFSKSLNFNIHSSPSLLVPVRDYEADEGYEGVTDGIKTSDLAGFGSLNAGFAIAMGRKHDGTGRKAYKKSLFSDGDWIDMVDGNSADIEISSGSALPGFFLRNYNSSDQEYYWWVSSTSSTPGSGFWMLGIMPFIFGSSFNFSKLALSLVSEVIYPQAILGVDGNVYVSYDYNIVKCEASGANGTVTDAFFTVTPNYRITSMCLYGQYLAIAIYSNGRSKVLLWDYASAQATESIEWGEGALMVLENLDGVLVGVTDKYVSSSLFPDIVAGGGAMQIKMWDGGDPVAVTEVKAKGTVDRAIEQYKYARNGTLYFYAKIPLDDTGTEYEEGIWAFGKTTSTQPYALSLHREIAGTSFEGFWGVGDFLYLPNSDDGSVSRTNSQASFTLTSEFETGLINDDDSSKEKGALGATVSFLPFESNQTLVVKYRKDGATGWTTLNATPAIQVGDISAAYPFEGNWQEIEFRIESTGGLTPSGLKVKFEELTNALD